MKRMILAKIDWGIEKLIERERIIKRFTYVHGDQIQDKENKHKKNAITKL